MDGKKEKKGRSEWDDIVERRGYRRRMKRDTVRSGVRIRDRKGWRVERLR